MVIYSISVHDKRTNSWSDNSIDKLINERKQIMHFTILTVYENFNNWITRVKEPLLDLLFYNKVLRTSFLLFTFFASFPLFLSFVSFPIIYFFGVVSTIFLCDSWFNVYMGKLRQLSFVDFNIRYFKITFKWHSNIEYKIQGHRERHDLKLS